MQKGAHNNIINIQYCGSSISKRIVEFLMYSVSFVQLFRFNIKPEMYKRSPFIRKH